MGQAYFLFIQGRELESKGDVAGAVAKYREVLAIVPDAADVHAELAGVFARQGRADESIAEANAALKSDPKNGEAHRILGFVQAALAGNTQDSAKGRALMTDAIGHLEQSLKSGAIDPGAQITLGRLYVRTGNHAKGIVILRAFLLSQPDYPEALMLLAEAYDGTNQPDKAAEILEQIVATQPDSLPARGALADAYERSGRWIDAASAWAEIAKRNPRTTVYASRQAMALVNGGDLAGGRQKLLEITAAKPSDVATWYVLAQVEKRAGNLDASEAAAQKILAIDTADARGLLSMAAVKVARKDYRAAIDMLDPPVKSPRDSDIESGVFAGMVEQLSAALQASGDKARSMTVYEEARKRDPQDPTLFYGLAGAYERADRVDRAERLYRDLIATQPDNSGLLNSLGYLLADHGQKLDEAVMLVTRALVLEPDNPSYLDSLGWAYFKQSKWDQARTAIEKAATGLSRSSVVLSHLGEVYFQLKRYRDAADAWDRSLKGDRAEIDVDAVTKKRDKARELAGR